jgi:hypothetical protein
MEISNIKYFETNLYICKIIKTKNKSENTLTKHLYNE